MASQSLPLSIPLSSAAKETDTHKLWRNIEPHLKKAMQTVYLREVSRFDPSHLRPLRVCCLLTIFPLPPPQSSVGADAADGGEGMQRSERYGRTLAPWFPW